jgi:hypothetical protein
MTSCPYQQAIVNTYSVPTITFHYMVSSTIAWQFYRLASTKISKLDSSTAKHRPKFPNYIPTSTVCLLWFIRHKHDIKK